VKLPFRPAGGSTGAPMWAMGTGDPVRVLLIDDDDDEAALTRSLLTRVTDVRYELDWVPSFGEGLASIARDDHDAYLIDHQLGGRTGVELVREAREAGSLAALIMLTGQRDRTTDLAAMNAGATDFLLKGRTDSALLDRSLRYAIFQAAAVAALDRSRNQLAGLEELGQLLADNGPTPATVARIVDLIVDRFSLPRVAIYLADGETLRLAGQRGYENPLLSVSRADSSVERVARARKPIFVPSLSPELGADGAIGAVATELSVPLLVAGEMEGLLNVASSVAAPIGEEDFSAIRLVADRLTAALEVVRERDLATERLRDARQQPATPQGLLDGETSAYRRALLEPLLDVAIATSGTDAGRAFGILLVACEDSGPAAVTRLAEQTRAACPSRPLIRVAETELAVLIGATDHAVARSEASALVALAQAAELVVWCGYAALASGWGATELLAAADAALAYARRLGPGTVIG
jgi:FixJ family two-component response regulator